MKAIYFAFIVSLLCSCGSDGGKFRLEGRLRNINQGEFWVYSPDGGMAGIDTITVRSGRFSYELDLTDDATLVVVFPNYSEQPVFARPGKSVSIKGDATHLKEMIIQGTSENEDMTTLRLELNDLTPPDIPGAVSEFIQEHLDSRVSIYLLYRYFILCQEPDYRQALKLTRLMLKEAEGKPLEELQQLEQQLKRLQGGAVDGKLAKFKVKDVKGQLVTESSLKRSLNVVNTWASWNYQSTNMLRRLKELKKKHGERLAVISICVDGERNNCLHVIKRDSISWPTICDGKMWNTPLLSTFGLADVPGNILIDGKGHVIARNLPINQLEDRINNVLK